MKIGILGTRGIPNNYGGFEQFAQWLSKGLVDKGHEVYVYSSSHHPYQEKIWKGVHIIHCKDREYRIGTAGQFFYDLRCNKDAVKRNFDVLFHFGYSSDSFWGRRWPKNTINIVNMDGLEWKRTKYNFLTRKFLKQAESWAAKHADKMIADSPAIRDYIFETYAKEPVYIPYGAEIFTNRNASVLTRYRIMPGQYFLVIARMEPENNIEMIIEGWKESKSAYPLLIIGNANNKYGQRLVKKYKDLLIRFEGAIYDQETLNNLRFFSKIYFHGHSVGGTNPSLLEAMACGCRIAAHDNQFNKGVLGNEADYFSTAADLSALITAMKEPAIVEQNISMNLEKIRTSFNPDKIIMAYEELIDLASTNKKPG